MMTDRPKGKRRQLKLWLTCSPGERVVDPDGREVRAWRVFVRSGRPRRSETLVVHRFPEIGLSLQDAMLDLALVLQDPDEAVPSNLFAARRLLAGLGAEPSIRNDSFDIETSESGGTRQRQSHGGFAILHWRSA